MENSKCRLELLVIFIPSLLFIMAENTSNGVDYQINFINNSTNAGNFMVFQQDSTLNGPDITSLAWIRIQYNCSESSQTMYLVSVG